MDGPRIISVASAIIVASSVLLFRVDGTDEEGLRAVIRLTARTSLVLFVLAFSASALHRLWTGATTRWLLTNRRYVGLSFAASHLFHLLAIVALATRFQESFWAHTQASTIVVGGIGYVFVAAMAATSNDASVAWLGPRRWHLLHLVGAYWIWSIFLISYGSRAVLAPANVLPLILVVGAWGLRLAARRRQRALAIA